MRPLLEENSLQSAKKLKIKELPSNDIVAIVSKKKGFFIGYLKEADSEHFLLLDKTQGFDGDPLKINKKFIDEAWAVWGKINYNIQNKTDLLSILHDKIDKIENIVSSSGY